MLRPSSLLTFVVVCVCLLWGTAEASLGDRLPEFRECVEVCARENCDPNNNPTHIPFHRRLLFWTCPQECDYTCQHIITQQRLAAGQPVTQFHGKWPFVRVLGMQEPFSVLFSLGNLVAHQNGLAKIRQSIPAAYSLRKYYELFACFGIATWIFSSIFHIRDFRLTEQLDYFAAGAGVLYGMYYTPIRVFRLDKPTPRRQSVLRLWTVLCCSMYIAHVAYLKLWRWNYTYNMAANVTVGLVQNSLWSYFSWKKWTESRQAWAIWPGVAVAWLMTVMSLELLDFPPLWGALDAHSLWHLGTIGPTVLWYNFMVKDSQENMAITTKMKDTKA
ncbi:Per1-domain-containing protein [Annulohypoxylon truncatum]|uniref:Per1-domain-containing protein n=1 Tax=Annulohypoxylon truncatum TaxID=327061 RepID=UPI0020072839|nr:Per1-domain-containing protein [Annulohypoxylon truncatum]KAI1208779.1 Per1-domain-containing protein [Annulohypoxylon truncatum]